MMKFTYEVFVSLKKGILDPQGLATQKVLKRLDYNVDSVLFGKTITLEINSESEEKANKTIETIASEVLTNPVMENYEIKLIKTGELV